MHAHETESIAHERAHRMAALGMLLGGIAAVALGLAVLLYVAWLILSGPKATPFDADGVRCYRAGTEMSCIKTAEPAR